MAYNENIPQPTTNPSNDQPLILDNFKAISTVVNVNHINFDEPGKGKHKFLQMPEQSSAPATAVNELGVYSKQSTLTAQAEMFIRRESNGTEIEFTSFLGATNGWTRLASGILLKWGSGTGSGITVTNFPTGATIPVFVSVFNGLVSVEDTSPSPNTFTTLRSISTTAITVFNSKRTSSGADSATFRYLVIGI